jgi:hypothetical protein
LPSSTLAVSSATTLGAVSSTIQLSIAAMRVDAAWTKPTIPASPASPRTVATIAAHR